MRFWSFQGGGEYWVSPERYATMTQTALENKRRRYAENPAHFRNLRKEFFAANRARLLKQGAVYDKKRRECPKRMAWKRSYVRLYRKKNPSFDIGIRLRVRMANAIRRSKAYKSESTERLLGCKWAYFLAHLEAQFTDGMTWENRSLWHIDHIIPCCAFDLTKPEEQAKCFHYTNLRPLWASENLSKNGKY